LINKGYLVIRPGESDWKAWWSSGQNRKNKWYNS
jgi:hypothetical protein